MLTLERLSEIASSVIGQPIELRADQSAEDVLGWDSLNNTLIALQVATETGAKVDGATFAEARNFGDLVERVNVAL